MSSWAVHGRGEPPRGVVALAEQVERDRGHPLAIYQEPAGEHWQIFCLRPVDGSRQQTFARLTSNLECFDATAVRYQDVQRAAVVAPPAGDQEAT